jgi:hypothetical protein
MVMTAPDEKRDLYSPARKPPERPVLARTRAELDLCDSFGSLIEVVIRKFQNILHGRFDPPIQSNTTAFSGLPAQGRP